jgi:hypothetical protein
VASAMVALGNPLIFVGAAPVSENAKICGHVWTVEAPR